MKPSIAAKLDQLSTRLEEINRLLSTETVTADLDNYRRLTREHAELGPVVVDREVLPTGEAPHG